jgi:hydrogenase-4 component B
MGFVTTFILILFLSVLAIPWVKVKWKGLITVAAVMIMAGISSIIAFRALMEVDFEYLLSGSLMTGEVPVRVDALSGWFILIINFTFITGAFYGLQYLKAYSVQRANLSLHAVSFLLVQASLIGICSLQNSIAFLIAWEIMALSSFVLVIFEHNRRETLNAGMNYLIQSHICIMLLTLGFIWVALKMDSYDFSAIARFSSSNTVLNGLVLFLCFFTGFAVKAGFVPFHTWLPYAHPVAPSHVSGIMSGVLIKIGIYGILRMLLLIKVDYLIIGYIIFLISIVSGLYGVMLAIVQHNLKRLLAYHSIENIGIIGMGIGLGCIGIGKGNHFLASLGYAGALLHVVNHALFKSLLFYGAGNVYQAKHTTNLERLGGLAKQMPHTTILFLIAALAICGLPPFNGFVSEFLIYMGMFSNLESSDKTLLSWIVFGIFALSLIGGLAMLCFTKAFGTVFLGRARHPWSHTPGEFRDGRLFPMYMIVTLMMAIGLFPHFFIKMISGPLTLFTGKSAALIPVEKFQITEVLSMVGLSSAGFLLLAGIVYFIRRRTTMTLPESQDTTWGCGYVGPSVKMQYTASSFVRAYRKLAEPVLLIHKKKKEVTGVFPSDGGHETHPYDKAEAWLIDYPLRGLRSFLNQFAFLQNGNLQFYILYGLVFITLILIIPFVLGYLESVIEFLNSL